MILEDLFEVRQHSPWGYDVSASGRDVERGFGFTARSTPVKQNNQPTAKTQLKPTSVTALPLKSKLGPYAIAQPYASYSYKVPIATTVPTKTLTPPLTPPLTPTSAIATPEPTSQVSVPEPPIEKTSSDAIDNMVKALSKAATSSTGGSIINTPTGRIHTAKSIKPVWTGPKKTKSTPISKSKKAKTQKSKRPTKTKFTLPPNYFSKGVSQDTRDQFMKKVLAAAQKKQVAESLIWSDDFDPSVILINQIMQH